MIKMQKIGLFGGTFNPPHIGHARALDSFCASVGLDAVYIMPSSIPPHKEIADGDIQAKRFHMARIAFAFAADGKDSGCKRIFSAMEISRSGKSYSIDTVNELLKISGCKKIYMYIGSDMLFYFEKWKNFRELFEKCIIVTAARSKNDEKLLKKCCDEYRRKYGAVFEYILLPIEPFDISSTELREIALCQNENRAEELKKYLTDELCRYIIDNDIYGRRKSADDITEDPVIARIRRDIVSEIDEARLEHTFSVEKTALDMASIYLPLYGFGKEYLRDISAAALLHDITKCKNTQWQESYLSQFMYMESESLNFPAVYHSWSGAYFALEKYFVNPRVFRAVYNHTTGRRDMDIFEKIIYLADFIEPGRKHASCVALREKFKTLVSACNMKETDSDGGESLKKVLDEIILDSLRGTLLHLSESGKPVCPELYEAKNFLECSSAEPPLSETDGVCGGIFN